jgi:hypothetical protein
VNHDSNRERSYACREPELAKLQGVGSPVTEPRIGRARGQAIDIARLKTVGTMRRHAPDQ